MKIFADANILVTVLNKEYPVFPYASRILSLNGRQDNRIVTSSICLAIAYYFAEKKHGYKLAKQKINLLVQNIGVVDCGEKEVKQSITNKKINDFEDGLEYYAALNAKCNCIVSEDVNDFYFADMEVFTAEKFLKKYFK